MTARLRSRTGPAYSPVSAAMLVARPGITSVVLGPRTADQLTANLAGLTVDLPADTTARLEAATRFTVTPPVDGRSHAA